MRKKQPVPFAQKFPNADPLALRLLERLLAFDPKDRPTAEEVLHFPIKSLLYFEYAYLKSAFCIWLYWGKLKRLPRSFVSGTG